MPKNKVDWTSTFNGTTYEGKAGEELGDIPQALYASLKAAQVIDDSPAPRKKGSE